MTCRGRSAGLAAGALFLAHAAAIAAPVVINSNTSDPVPKAAFAAIVEQFRKENPDLEVTVNYYDHESYKTAIRNWLVASPPDVVLWFSGNRMRQFVEPGLLAEVSDLWTEAHKARFTPAALELVSVDGRQYGVPYSYYNIGIYYRKDLFERAGLAPVSDWGDLLEACDRLNAIGVEPIVIGTKNLWPAAGWFDYLDLRMNGFAFHMALMGGGIPYSDRRVLAVFDRWRELLDKNCFADNHTGMTWQESQALLYQAKGAMMLMGAFVVQSFPPDIADKIGFVPFPEIAADVSRAEEAPMNSVHVPARAANIDGGKAFAAFMMRADVQEAYNRATGTLPPNQEAGVPAVPLLQEGRSLLASATAISQYFDRDTSEDLALIAMRGFQEFMVKPDRRDKVVAEIERARQRIYSDR